MKDNMQDNMQNENISEVMSEKDKEQRNKKYNKYVDSVTPRHKWSINMFRAFFIGGITCLIGEAFNKLYIYMGCTEKTAGLYEILTLIFLSVLLTGLNIFPKIAKFAGAGVIVPITGFANSVASPAIEFQKEGQVYGIGCKIFTIAGPVILFGMVSSWVLGIIYWLMRVFGVA